MAGEVYGQFEYAPKPYTRGQDVGKGQIGLPNVAPPFFLEIRLIKTHTHTGVDSPTLTPEATPYVPRAYKTYEREEHAIASWTGGSASSGSFTLTYGNPFREAPTVIVVSSGEANANVVCAVGTPGLTSVTVYWKDTAGNNHTALNFQYLIKGK